MKQRESISQFLRFGLIGFINTGIDFCIYILLTRYTDFFSHEIYFANTLAFLGATTFSFFANRAWTFEKENRPTFGEALRFLSTTGSGFLLSTGILFIAVNLGGFDLVGKAVAIFFTLVWNFILNKFWVFNQDK